MGRTALLNIANILVLAAAAHGVYPAHLGLGKKRCRVTSVTTVLAACRQCAAQMRRSPTPWLSEGTAPNRTAAPAIGIPILRLNQLQPGGCTQLHHLNEAMCLFEQRGGDPRNSMDRYKSVNWRTVLYSSGSKQWLAMFGDRDRTDR